MFSFEIFIQHNIGSPSRTIRQKIKIKGIEIGKEEVKLPPFVNDFILNIKNPEEGNDNPLKYSCLKNSVHRGAWWATVHGVAESQTQLSN